MSTPLFHYLLIHWLIAFIPIGLGIFVISKDRNNPLYRAFLQYNFVISWWGWFNLFMEYSKNEGQALFWDRISLLGIVYIPATFLHFTWMYSGKSRFYKSGIRLAYLLSTFFLMFVFSPWMAKSATPKYIIPYFTDPGLLYHFFVFYFVSVMTLGNILVLKAYLTADTRQRKTGTRLFLIATSLSTIGGGGNFMVPYEVYTPILFPYGGYAFILYGLLITYTILRYKFLDIEVIIKKTLVFAGLASFVFGVFAFVTFVLQNWVSRYVQLGQTATTLISVLAVILGYEPIRNFLINVTDRYLFQKKSDYGSLLKEAGQQMAKVQSLEALSKLVIAFLIKKGRISGSAIYVRSGKEASFNLIASRPRIQNPAYFKLAEDHPLISFFKTERRALELQELQALAQENPQSGYQPLIAVLKATHSEVIIPSYRGLGPETTNAPHREDALELMSLLFLGPKKSDEPYTAADLNVFYTLAQQSAMAVENARLYDEGIQKTQEVAELKVQLAVEERKSILANLTGGIAHEVNNPLSYSHYAASLIKKIAGRLEELIQKATNPDFQAPLTKASKDLLKYAELINLGTARIKGAVLTIENFARKTKQAESGESVDKFARANLAFDPINLKLILPLILLELRYKYKTRNQELCDIEIDIDKNLPELYGNQKSLEQVFINFISNANEAMMGREHKKLTIKAELDSDDKEFAHLSFQDTGGGMSEELIKTIFEYRKTTKADQGGSGIGLYVCRNIVVEIHGGRIWCNSEVGIGSAFHIKVPIWKGDPLTLTKEAMDLENEN